MEGGITMSVRRAEFPFLENAMDIILKFNEVEQNKIREMEKRKALMERFACVKKVYPNDLIDMDTDFVGSNREVREVVLRKKNYPILMMASHTHEHLKNKKKKKLEKPAQYVNRQLQKRKAKCKSTLGQTMCDLAWLAIRSKFGL